MKIKTFVFCTVSMLLSGVINAQQLVKKKKNYIGNVELLRKTTISLGSGMTFANSETEALGVGNSTNINLGIYNPFCQNKKFGFGLHGFLSYALSNEKKSFSALPIAGYTSSTSIDNEPKLSGITFGIGPQFNFPIAHKLLFSPIVDFAYVNQKINSFTVNQSYTDGFFPGNKDIYSQTETKASGIGFIPRLRLQYWLSESVGLWIEGNYAINPKFKTTTTTLEPSENQIGGSYSIDDILMAASLQNEVTKNNNGIGVGAGLLISFGDRNTCFLCALQKK